MEAQEKLRRLKSLHLLGKIPDGELAGLAKLLDPVEVPGGGIVFEEGSRGDSLYFVSSGHVRIAKKVLRAHAEMYKELSILGPGDCFGEMAVFEEIPRSARAVAQGDVLLFKLGRRALRQWLRSTPLRAVGFFSELSRVLSQRLRRSTQELALLYDLSQWLLEPVDGGKGLLEKALQHLVPYLEGSWSAGAYLYNEFDYEMELVATDGDFSAVTSKGSVVVGRSNTWLDDRTFLLLLPGKQRPAGYLILHSAAILSDEQRNETSRTLSTAGRLLTSALENIGHRQEEAMRARLRASRQHDASGL